MFPVSLLWPIVAYQSLVAYDLLRFNTIYYDLLRFNTIYYDLLRFTTIYYDLIRFNTYLATYLPT